jgi:hypothetical protein
MGVDRNLTFSPFSDAWQSLWLVHGCGSQPYLPSPVKPCLDGGGTQSPNCAKIFLMSVPVAAVGWKGGEVSVVVVMGVVVVGGWGGGVTDCSGRMEGR